MFRIGVDKAVAGALAGARVCALRYDKRGVGASGGEYLRAGMDDRRTDARPAAGARARRDLVTCSKPCRQARHRFSVLLAAFSSAPCPAQVRRGIFALCRKHRSCSRGSRWRSR